MYYPLIHQNSTYPEEPICQVCGKNKVFEPHNFIALDGGAFLLDKHGNSKFPKKFEGFLDLTWHGHHYEDIEDESKDTFATLKVVKESTCGQFSLYFCSTDCLRKFFDNLVDDFEKEISKAKRPKEELIVIDYYKGAYGPTIQIDIHEREYLFKLKELTATLKETDKTEISLKMFDETSLTGLTDLILVSEHRLKICTNPIHQQKNSLPIPTFIWAMNSERWEDCERLIDGLINLDNPGHQHLLSERNDVLIKLAYME